jgi:mono/diheme cytochrome c family protein
MRRRTFLPLVLAASGLLTACGSSLSTGDSHARIARGRLHYLSTCSRCHQPNGRGYAQIYPNLAGNPIVNGADPTPVIEIVMQGRNSMPSFGSEPPQVLAEIITYIRHSWGNHASPVTPSQVK